VQRVAIGTLGPDERDGWGKVGQSISPVKDGESVTVDERAAAAKFRHNGSEERVTGQLPIEVVGLASG